MVELLELILNVECAGYTSGRKAVRYITYDSTKTAKAAGLVYVTIRNQSKKKLPIIRLKLGKDLSVTGYPQNKVLAAMVKFDGKDKH